MLVHNKQGCIWHCGYLHVYMPGTVLNDQYTRPDAWDDFLSPIEKSRPSIKALGITAYYSIVTYAKTIVFKKAGRLVNVGLIFPKVELRFNPETS